MVNTTNLFCTGVCIMSKSLYHLESDNIFSITIVVADSGFILLYIAAVLICLNMSIQ